MNKYPENIMSDVRRNLGLQPDDTSRDEFINKMPKSQVFSCVCNWHGLIGYGDTIRRWLEEIYGEDIMNRE